MNNSKTTAPSHEHTNLDYKNQPVSDDTFVADSFANEVKGKKGLARIVKATGYSIDGFKAAYKFEAAFRQVIWLNLLLFMVIIFMPFNVTVKMVLVIASFLSIIVELINTGIEASVDHTSTDHHPFAKIAKDVGSAAQFLALLLLFVLWCMALSNLLF